LFYSVATENNEVATLVQKKRGRPKTGGRKGVPVGLRFTKELRDLLEDARRASGGRSLSQEIEQRLWHSFTMQQQIEQRFGGPTTSDFLSIVADGIMAIETFANGQERWFNNTFLFEQVRTMLDVMLDHRKPRGRRTLPKNMQTWHPLLKADAKNKGRKTALERLKLLDACGNKREKMPDVYPPSAHYFNEELARDLHVDRLRAERRKLRQETRLREERYWESRGISVDEDARQRMVDALNARSPTVNGLVAYLKQVEGANIDIAKVLKGVTGANFVQQKPAIIRRIKSAIKGATPNLEINLGQLLDAATKWETSDETISDAQHRKLQRRGEEAREEADRIRKKGE
jgi:hypothetical protein